MTFIDLNCDMGEMPEAIADGTQESLMPFLTSVSIACGGHAGDAQTIDATVEQALRWKLAIGAHPGYPDRANFGRAKMTLAPEAIAQTVFEQVTALAEIASRRGARLQHVKPHGALYNEAARDRVVARAIADGVSRWCSVGVTAGGNSGVMLLGLAGSEMMDVFRGAGFPVAAEAFADRIYEVDGSLRSRKFDDALIRDPAQAGRQAIQIAQEGCVTAHGGKQIAMNAQTICIHGDTPDAADIAAAVNYALKQVGVTPRAMSA